MGLFDAITLLLLGLALAGMFACAFALLRFFRRLERRRDRVGGALLTWLFPGTLAAEVLTYIYFLLEGGVLLWDPQQQRSLAVPLLLSLAVGVTLVLLIHRRQGGWRVQLALTGLLACSAASAAIIMYILCWVDYSIGEISLYHLVSVVGLAFLGALLAMLYRWHRTNLLAASRPARQLAFCMGTLSFLLLPLLAGLFFTVFLLNIPADEDLALYTGTAAGLGLVLLLLCAVPVHRLRKKTSLRLGKTLLVCALLPIPLVMSVAAVMPVIADFYWAEESLCSFLRTRTEQENSIETPAADLSQFADTWAKNDQRFYALTTLDGLRWGLFSVTMDGMEDLQEILLPGDLQQARICGITEDSLLVELPVDEDGGCTLYEVDLESHAVVLLERSIWRGAFWYHADSDSLLRVELREDYTMEVSAEQRSTGERHSVFRSKMKYVPEYEFFWTNLEHGELLLQGEPFASLEMKYSDSGYPWPDSEDFDWFPEPTLFLSASLDWQRDRRYISNHTTPEPEHFAEQMTHRLWLIGSTYCYGRAYYLHRPVYAVDPDSQESRRECNLYRAGPLGIGRTMLRRQTDLYSLFSLNNKLFASGKAQLPGADRYDEAVQGVFELNADGTTKTYIGPGNHLVVLENGLLMTTAYNGSPHKYSSWEGDLRGLFPGEFAGLYGPATGKHFPPLPGEELELEEEYLPPEPMTELPEYYSTREYAVTPEYFYLRSVRYDDYDSDAYFTLRRVSLDSAQEERIPLPQHNGMELYDCVVIGVTEEHLYLAGWHEEGEYAFLAVYRLSHADKQAEFLTSLTTVHSSDIRLSPWDESLIYVNNVWDWENHQETALRIERYDLDSGETSILYDALPEDEWLGNPEYTRDGKLAISTKDHYVVVEEDGSVQLQPEAAVALLTLEEAYDYSLFKVGYRWQLMLRPWIGSFFALIDVYSDYVLR